MRDEPRNHPWLLILLAVTALATVPVLFIGRRQIAVLGLPLWLWSSLLFTVILSGLTTWGVLHFWRDDDLD